MAQCKASAHEFIKDVFSPVLAVHCTNEVQQICSYNNLTFAELIQPFCKLNFDTNIHDPLNMSFVMHNLRLNVKDMNVKPPSLPVGKKMIHDAVLLNQLSENAAVLKSVQANQYNFKINSSTPWFEAYRNVFFYISCPTEHEFTHNFLGCIFVISASSEDAIATFEELVQQQVQHQQQGLNYTTKWFLPNPFKYYVLLHDVSRHDLKKSEINLQKVKNKFGDHCHLLQINSLANEINNSCTNNADPWVQFLNKVPIAKSSSIIDINKHLQNDNLRQSDSLTDLSDQGIVSPLIDHPLSLSSESVATPLGNHTLDDSLKSSSYKDGLNMIHGQCLNTRDIDKIKEFIKDLVVHGLIPYVERNIKLLNEQVPNKKGKYINLFNFSKKWLGAGNKAGQGPPSSTTSVIYNQDAAELLVRKLGDLAFMFQLYDLAYQCYHSAKRDFENEQAWLYFAGALEMASLSLFMQNPNNPGQYRQDYMEKAIITYLNYCKSPQFATRATLLSTECLKSKGLYNEAALQFIRMTHEDSDLRSALLLEQAAHCFLNIKFPSVRKYAFHVVLAGFRFSKAGQRKHSLRAYRSASQIFHGTNWKLAEDHIDCTIARQTIFLKQFEEAHAALGGIFTVNADQSAAHQSFYFREYLVVLKELSGASEEVLPQLTVPHILAQKTRVLLGGEASMANANSGSVVITGRDFDETASNSVVWEKLEELAFIHAQGSLNSFLNPQKYIFTENTINTQRPQAIRCELITVELHIQNPLRIPLYLDNLHLLWQFETVDPPCFISNESGNLKENSVVITEVVPELAIDSSQTSRIKLSLRPLQTGQLNITGICFNIRYNSTVQPQVNGDQEDVTKQALVLSVKGKCDINIMGRRLNVTKDDRVKVNYANDFRLKPLVIGPMPKLEIEMNDHLPVLLCGEVRKINVIFKNVGHQDLHRLLVVSPTPNVFFFGHDREGEDHWLSYKEISCDPDNTTAPLIAEPQTMDYAVEIFYPDCNSLHLAPGESYSVPLWIRGPDIPGEHVLDMLFYYESLALSSTKPQYRLLHYSSILNTLPSLSLKGELTRSNSLDVTTNSLVLALDTTNINEVAKTEISVLQLSSLSKDWSIVSLNSLIHKGAITIQPQETLNLSFKILPYNHRAPISSDRVVVFSQAPFGKSEIDCSSSPCSDFSWRASCKLPPLTEVKFPQKANPLEMVAVPTKKIPTFYKALKDSQNLELTLTVLWKAKVERYGQSHIIMGQHHITINQLECATSTVPTAKPLNLQPPLSLTSAKPEIATEELPDLNLVSKAIKCLIKHPPIVYHDFKKNKLCFVPVKLILQNCCSIKLWLTADVAYDAKSASKSISPMNSPISPDESYSCGSFGFTWVGSTSKQRPLEPLGSLELPFTASFCLPGTYLLGCLLVKVSTEKNSTLGWQQAVPPCLIVISQPQQKS